MLKYFTPTAEKDEPVSDTAKVSNYTHFMETPLKCVGCWDWYRKPLNEFQIVLNNVYMSFSFFVLTNLLLSLILHLYSDWTDLMAGLSIMADGLPIIASLFIVSYFAIYRKQLYELVDYTNSKFKWCSARGLTNMTMSGSYKTARKFGYFYSACTIFSVTMYTVLPVAVHSWTKQPLQHWVYEGVSEGLILGLIFLRQCIAQGLVGLAVGQLGVFFSCNSIILCGQLDLLCCCLRNVRYTALMQRGMIHGTLAAKFKDIILDEEHSYLYNRAKMSDSSYHYDNRWVDINNLKHDDATMIALQDCARMSQVVKEYRNRFEKFVSPLLALRVVQVTLYLCTLLYAASLKFDMVTVEYLAAVALDIFVYCYFGNQIILQADRVSLAGYQCAWPMMGVKPRRLLLNIMLANRRPMLIRAGNFLPMNLETFILIIKTSFSYYTLLVKVNE